MYGVRSPVPAPVEMYDGMHAEMKQADRHLRRRPAGAHRAGHARRLRGVGGVGVRGGLRPRQHRDHRPADAGTGRRPTGALARTGIRRRSRSMGWSSPAATFWSSRHEGRPKLGHLEPAGVAGRPPVSGTNDGGVRMDHAHLLHRRQRQGRQARRAVPRRAGPPGHQRRPRARWGTRRSPTCGSTSPTPVRPTRRWPGWRPSTSWTCPRSPATTPSCTSPPCRGSCSRRTRRRTRRTSSAPTTCSRPRPGWGCARSCSPPRRRPTGSASPRASGARSTCRSTRTTRRSPRTPTRCRRSPAR